MAGRFVIAVLAVLPLLAACSDPELEGDCVERLFWKGREYDGLRSKVEPGPLVGRAASFACGEHLGTVALRRVPGVRPSIAVVVSPRGQRSYVGLGAGYLIESPAHPFHDEMVGSMWNEPDRYDLQRCGPPRDVPARALRTPLPIERPLQVAALRAKDRRYVTGRGVQGILTMDARTEIADRLDRLGVPYVEAGDHVRLRLRACRFTRQAEPGLRGLAQLNVVRVAPL